MASIWRMRSVFEIFEQHAVAAICCDDVPLYMKSRPIRYLDRQERLRDFVNKVDKKRRIMFGLDEFSLPTFFY